METKAAKVAKAYFSRAKELARFFSRVGVIDHASVDYDDFVAEMALKGWLAWHHYGRTRGYGIRGETAYVLRAMRNRAKDMVRAADIEGWDSLAEEPCDECCLHHQVDARLKLARLDRYLQGWQREILAAVAVGESGSAYAASRGWHHSRLASARKQAAKILGAD